MKGTTQMQLIRIFPVEEGWCLLSEGVREVQAELADLVKLVPSGVTVELLVPSSGVMMERFDLPKASKEELMEMTQLQLEKLLPYGVDEVVFDIEIEPTPEEETVRVVALVVGLDVLEASGGLLRGMGVSLSGVGLLAQQNALLHEAEAGVTLMVWKELDRPFVVLAERGKILWMEGLAEVPGV